MFHCVGACWSFSATGAIEGINKIVTGSLVSLSEQELVDCDKSFDSGCEGGLMDYAYEFVMDNHGIDTEEDYPYQGRERSCNREKVMILRLSLIFTSIPSNLSEQNFVLIFQIACEFCLSFFFSFSVAAMIFCTTLSNPSQPTLLANE